MKKRIALLSIFLLVAMFALLPAINVSAGGGINNPPGNPLYVIIEVTWDGNPAHAGSWTVWGPKWSPSVGTGIVLASCPGGGSPGSCLDMSTYQFIQNGRTLQFDEFYVSGVDATPQVRHVVLVDQNGDGTYTGSLPSERYTFPSRPGEVYHDSIDYTITLTNGKVASFRYLEYEHRKIQ